MDNTFDVLKKAFQNDYELFIKLFNKWSEATKDGSELYSMDDWIKNKSDSTIPWDRIDRFDRCDGCVFVDNNCIWSTDDLHGMIDCDSTMRECIKYYADLLDVYKELKGIKELSALIEPKEEEKPLYEYSFCSKGNCTKEEIKKLLETTDKPFVYTVGFEYKKPTTHRVWINRDKALEIFNKESQLDITEEKYCVHINEFTANDMW